MSVAKKARIGKKAAVAVAGRRGRWERARHRANLLILKELVELGGLGEPF